MLSDRLRVFVSSKMAELAAERAAIKEVLNELEVDAWVFEQDAGARPETIEESYKEQLEASDLYLGVFWKGYGAYTIDEFEHARATDKDCLIYQKGGAEAAGRDPELRAFLDRIGRVETGLTVQFFDTPEELREMVTRDVARWQTRIVRKYRRGSRRGGGLPADPDLVVLRTKVRQSWIEGVLGRAVAEGGLVDLSREVRPDAVADPPAAGPELAGEGGVIDPGTSATQVFEGLQRSLLILGQAGAGKTTTALMIARDLITRAERDESQPVPVVLNLSAWSPDSRTLGAWIARELSRKYHVPDRISRPWLEQDRLVLVLDGLDEVAAEHRAACVEAVNRFGDEVGCGGLVVTSRLAEYEALPARLRVGGAICLQPLLPAQVDAYLEKAGEPLAGLRTALESDEALRELTRSPLMLSVMSVAYRDRTDVEADASDSAETRRARLFGTYVERALQQRGTARSYAREATASWLSWLARRMKERSQTLFLIEDLQPSWLASRAQLAAYLVGFALLFGLVFGGLAILYRMTPSAIPGSDPVPPGLRESVAWLVASTVFLLGIGITDGFRDGSRAGDPRAGDPRAGDPRAVVAYLRRIAANLVIFGLLWAPIVWVLIHLLEPDREYLVERFVVPVAAMVMGAAALGARRSLSRSIETTESLKLEAAAAGRGALWGLLGGAVFAIVGYLEIGQWWAVLFWPLLGSAFGAVLKGFVPRLVRGKTVPNQGMLLTFKTSARAAAMAVPLAVVATLYCVVPDDPYYLESEARLVRWGVTALVFSFVILAAWFGGLDLGKHYLLRAVLGETRQAPWSFRRLLDDASRRNLMQRVGGGYLFLHRPLLEHFAALDLPPPEADEIHDRERRRAASSAPAVAATAALAAIGAVMLFAGLERGSAAAVAAGAILLGTGALWLIVRTAVASALRADRREGEEE